VVAYLAAYQAAGYDFIKIHDETPEIFDSVLAAARRLGLPVVGHVPVGVPLERAIAGGMKSIEHLTRHLASNGKVSRSVWNCPTQLVHELYAWDRDTLMQWPEMRYVSDGMLKRWWRESERSAFALRTARIMIESFSGATKSLHDAGAELLLGTDTGVPFLVPGFSMHRELEALVRAGLTPYEALETGTRNVAAYFGALDSTGTVAVGKRADLVLLYGNPLENIGNTAPPAGVMIEGRWLPQAELNARLKTLEGTLGS
jgi:imidazolonepropionase-like amidohydrolase